MEALNFRVVQSPIKIDWHASPTAIPLEKWQLPVSLANFQFNGRAMWIPSALTAWIREGP